MIDLNKLETLEKAATPIPWGHDEHELRWIWAFGDTADFICGPGREADAELLVAVRNALPDLIAELRTLRDRMEWLVHLDTFEGRKLHCDDAVMRENERLKDELKAALAAKETT